MAKVGPFDAVDVRIFATGVKSQKRKAVLPKENHSVNVVGHLDLRIETLVKMEGSPK